jgi:DNA-directed RNA polymerase subunit M/transcription elongation factor TFIIS
MPPKSSAKTKLPILLLHQSGELSEGAIQTAGALTLTAIQQFLKRKKGVECLATYKAKPFYLHLFGLSEGSEETQNQHQLPPPHESTPFYGDIVLVASKDPKSFETPVHFKPEEYEEFYTKMFDGGYESEEEEGEEAEAEVEGAAADLDAEEAAVDDEEEEVEEEEEAEEEEDAEEEAAAEDEEEAQPVVKPKAKKKKAAATKSGVAALLGTGSAYPNPPILSEAEQLQEELAHSPATLPLPAPRERIVKALAHTFEDHLPSEAFIALERAIYNGAIHIARQRHIVRTWDYPLFMHLYRMHAHHVACNFHPDSYVKNTELYEGYQRGELTFESIAAMNTYELFPSRWRSMFEAQQIREKKQLEGNKDRATDQFTCTRCWKKECTYYEMQTRSADEPMTIFITCLNCGKKWRQ